MQKKFRFHTSRPGNRRDYNAQDYDQRPHNRGFVQNCVYHRRKNVNTPNTGVVKPRRSQGGETGAQRGNSGNAPDGIRKVRAVANAPSTMQGCSNENLNTICDSEPGSSNFVNNVDALNNQGN